MLDELLSPKSADLEDSPSHKLPSSSGRSWFSSVLPEPSLRTMELTVPHVGFIELQISKHGPVKFMLVCRGVLHTESTNLWKKSPIFRCLQGGMSVLVSIVEVYRQQLEYNTW